MLFLDEPTTGLDPRSRDDLWQMLRELVADGTTLILTTQYLEEADRLADDIVVLDHGVTVAHGTPAELKARIGDDRIEVTVTAADRARPAAAVLAPVRRQRPDIDGEQLRVTASTSNDVGVIDVVRALDEPASTSSTSTVARRRSTTSSSPSPAGRRTEHRTDDTSDQEVAA